MELEELNIWPISEDVTGIEASADSGERKHCDSFFEHISIPQYAFDFATYVAADFTPWFFLNRKRL
jgi:hypothetical protein